jgi:hypothetical protein
MSLHHNWHSVIEEACEDSQLGVNIAVETRPYDNTAENR